MLIFFVLEFKLSKFLINLKCYTNFVKKIFTHVLIILKNFVHFKKYTKNKFGNNYLETVDNRNMKKYYYKYIVKFYQNNI